MTVRLSPENRTRAPLELGCSPLPSSITPAFTISSLNFAMAASSSSEGILPASESLVALTITMNRIVVLLSVCAGREPGMDPVTVTSNQAWWNRQAHDSFCSRSLSVCVLCLFFPMRPLFAAPRGPICGRSGVAERRAAPLSTVIDLSHRRPYPVSHSPHLRPPRHRRLPMTLRFPLSRRRFLATAAASTALTAAGGIARPYLSRAADRPLITHGVQSGDVSTDAGVIWARTDRPARMLAEVALSDSFKAIQRAVFVDALPESDFTANALIEGLPAGQDIFYRVRFQDLSEPNILSEAVTGRFRTAPSDQRSISFVWSGDTAGQGWGIDEARGGMRIYATMLRNRPDRKSTRLNSSHLGISYA